MTATIDPAIFKALQDTAGADFVTELVDTFLGEAPVMLAGLKEAMAAGDKEKFRRQAHSLKSNSLTFGATALASQARELELGGADAAKVAALEAEYARVATALAGMRHA